MITLKPLYESDDHRAVEKGVFSVALFGASPTWISSQICIRGSNDDSSLDILRTLKNVTCFDTFYFRNLPQYVGVPGFTQSNSLWERRCRNCIRTAPFSRAALSKSVNALA